MSDRYIPTTVCCAKNIKKDQLVNSINLGGTEVEAEFQIGSKEYKICRGIRPNKFEI